MIGVTGTEDMRLKMLRMGLLPKQKAPERDLAAMAIATKMKAQIVGYEQEVMGYQDIISAQRVAAGGIEGITDALTRMHELGVRAASGLLTAEQRGYIQGEVEQLQAEITRIAERTEFMGKPVIPELTAEALGVTGISMVTAPREALEKISTGLEKVIARGVEVGAKEQLYQRRIPTMRTQIIALTETWSRLAERARVWRG